MNFDTSNFSVGLNNNLPNSGMLGMLPAFDPHAMLLKRIADKKNMEQQQNIVVEPYREEDVKELEMFCKKYGILGISTKTTNPRYVIMLLKKRLGLIEDKNSNKILLNG